MGSAAIQLGTALGAKVIATAGSSEKLALCRDLGADVAIDYQTDDFAEAVLDATSGRGVDEVCDLVGGETTVRTFPCVAHGGRHVLAGFSGDIAAEDSGIVPRPIIFGNFDLCRVILSYHGDPAAAKRASGFNLFSRADGERVHASCRPSSVSSRAGQRSVEQSSTGALAGLRPGRSLPSAAPPVAPAA